MFSPSLLLLLLFSTCFAFYEENGPVQILDANKFNNLVLNSEKVWIVEFFAPWCGHCQALKPDYEKVAEALTGIVNVAAVDATENQELAQKYKVEGYPTLKIFVANKKKPIDYQGQRDAKSIATACLKAAKELVSSRLSGKAKPKRFEHAKPEPSKPSDSSSSSSSSEPDVSLQTVPAASIELYNQTTFDEWCSGKLICVLTFLPNILDSHKEGRLKEIETLNSVAALQGKNPFVFFWTEGGLYSEIEEALNLNFGYPATVAVNKEKGRYAVHTGSLTVQSVKLFLTGLSSGNVRTRPLPELPEFKTVEPWDGEDKQETAEEFDLNDL